MPWSFYKFYHALFNACKTHLIRKMVWEIVVLMLYTGTGKAVSKYSRGQVFFLMFGTVIGFDSPLNTV